MIEESYVGFETAKMLKEAGFDEVCSIVSGGKGDTCLMCERNSRLNEGQYSCPTQQLAARWLREVYKLHIVPDYNPRYGFFTGIWNMKNGKYEYYSNGIGPNGKGCWDDYEEAYENGLQEAIKMIKQQTTWTI